MAGDGHPSSDGVHYGDYTSPVSWLDRVSLLMILIGMIRSGATLSILSATTDEPMHVTAGVELLLRRTYTLQPENPPLPRVLFAAPLIAAGADFDPRHDPKNFVGNTLYSRHRYRTNLVLARAANLLFFAIAALCVWRLARRELGPFEGAVATFLFTMQPIVLGFAGIANHDMPATAGTALAMLAFSRWIERRTIGRAFVTGLAYGLSVGLKFSCLVFVPAACAALYAVKLFSDRELRRDWRAAAMAVPIAVAGGVLALWSSYLPTAAPYATFVLGFTNLLHMAGGLFESYALGRWGYEGWWWYFPLGVGLKTTLPSLLLIATAPFSLHDARRRNAFLAWLAAALAILAVAMPSRIDLGVRYVLPLYVPLTIAAAAAAGAMLQHAKRGMRIAALVLVAWHCINSLFAHPQYFAWFNEIAGRDPSRYLVDSNLDWGQDALLLKRELRKRRADSVGLAIVGMHDYAALGFPASYPVSPDIPATGWIAVGDHLYRRGLPQGGWRWLHGRPYERVGAAIRLYYIPHT